MSQKRSVIEKLLEARTGEEGSALPHDPDFAKAYPELWKWLTWRGEGTDYIKEPAILRIAIGVGCFTVTISDNDALVSLDAVSPTFAGIAQALEQALGGPNPAIKEWKGKELQLRKRKGVKKD